MTLECEIEMVQTLKELEEMFEHFKDAKYIIALKYCRQRLEQEIRIEKQAVELVVSHKKYDMNINKEKLKEAFKNENKFGKFITELTNKAIADIYGIKNYYSSEEWEGGNNEK